MTEMNKLLPCPFCGGVDTSLTETRVGRLHRGWSLIHYCEGPMDRMIHWQNPARAILVMAWNTRFGRAP